MNKANLQRVLRLALFRERLLLIGANCCVQFLALAHSLLDEDITLKKYFNAEDSRGMRKTKIMCKTSGQCVRFPQNAEGLAGLSYGSESMADSARISSDRRPTGGEKIRTIRFFFGQWPKGRP